MYLMNNNNVFGSDQFGVYRPDQGEDSGNVIYAKTFKLNQIHWKAIDHESHKCDEENTVGHTTSMCITTFLENTIGCTMNFQGSKPGLEM